jgi:uncharacterized protein (DUF779 family)
MMNYKKSKFRIGDIVLSLPERSSGVVTKIYNNQFEVWFTDNNRLAVMDGCNLTAMFR